MKQVEKAFAYITHRRRLLVFEHVDFPQAGVQIPAGTVEPGELPMAAAIREAREETGMTELSSPEFLGTRDFDARRFGKSEIHRRHFFHFRAQNNVAERWTHYERDASDRSHDAIALALYWLPLDGAEAYLIAEHGAMLPALLKASAAR